MRKEGVHQDLDSGVRGSQGNVEGRCPACAVPYVHPTVWSGGTTPPATPACECHAEPEEPVSVGPSNRPAPHLERGEPRKET